MDRQYHDALPDVSSDASGTPPRSPRRQVERKANASSSSYYALSGARAGLEPGQPSSPERDAISSHDHVTPDTEPSLAKILELHRNTPWIGDHLTPEDTSRTLRAYTSMAIAFAVCQRLDGEELTHLLTVALTSQDGRPAQIGIDEGAQAVLEALGVW